METYLSIGADALRIGVGLVDVEPDHIKLDGTLARPPAPWKLSCWYLPTIQIRQ
jgi:hypothetical protein